MYRKISIFTFLFTLFFLNFSVFAQEIYWERPAKISNTQSMYPKTINSENKSYIFWQEVDGKNQQIYISCRTYENLKKFTDRKKFIGPISYSGTSVPDIFTVAINKSQKIVITLLDSINGIVVYESDNEGETYSEIKIPDSSKMIAPRVYVDKDDNFRLFTTLGNGDSFFIYWAQSEDGKNWSNLVPFSGSDNMRMPFIPVLIPYKNKDIVVYQAAFNYVEGGRTLKSNQLYLTQRTGMNEEWSKPVLITNQNSLFPREKKAFSVFENQRPNLYVYQDKLFLAWERTEISNSAIYTAEISEQGLIQSTLSEVSRKGIASRPTLFEYNKDLYISWFDTGRGKESIYYAKKNGNMWEETKPVAERDDKYSSLYVSPIILSESDVKSDKLMAFIYQQSVSKTENTIMLLTPDRFAAPPTLIPSNFKIGKHSKTAYPQITLKMPDDVSGIRGYSYTWSQSENEIPETIMMKNERDTKISLTAQNGDGNYYLKVRVVDRAGNWSEPAGIYYYLDTTPPKAPEILLTNIDSNNILSSNNVRIKWNPSEDVDTVRYVYNVEKISDIPRVMYQSRKHPLKISKNQLKNEANKLYEKYLQEENRLKKKIPTISTTRLSTKNFENLNNGLYIIRVSAIDDVGNVSNPNIGMFILNKYEPSTRVDNIVLKVSDQYENILTISGDGFTYDGTITRIFIDEDGIEPYDLELKAENNDFNVLSNTKISDINIGYNLNTGSYKVLLEHSDRGIYISTKAFTITQRGIVKIDPDFIQKPKYSTDFTHFRYQISIYLVLILLIILLGFMGVIYGTNALRISLVQKSSINKEVMYLLTGVPMPSQTNKKKKVRQKSLKIILVRFTYFLIVAIVLAISIETGIKNVSLQKSTLTSGLEERSQVLLESLASNLRSLMPAENRPEIGELPQLKSAMAEANYVTIIGQKAGSKSNEELNYIWATDDPDIRDKISDDSVNYGYSQINEEIVNDILDKMKLLESAVRDDVASLEDEIIRIDGELKNRNPEIDPDYEQIAAAKAKKITEINKKISEIAKIYAGSYPEFNKDLISIKTSEYDYIFYRPVLYRQGNSRQYIHSVIIMKLSIETLIQSIQKETKNIVISALIIAFIAVLFGLIGTLIFASYIIKPIKILEDFVERFGRAKKKQLFDKTQIEIENKENRKTQKQRKLNKNEKNELIVLKDDEIGRLGMTINKMKEEIIHNEIEMDIQLDGSEVQNSFLPLNKGTTHSSYQDENLQAFGYYQAQSGVSGDFYDYKKLDDEWYIFIKSDASGHGSPAAFIMTVVATFFKEYVKDWNYKKNGTRINEVVYKINDFISSLGLKGKFATVIVALLNHKTGDLYLCNAGDNLVNIYREKQHKVEVLTLNNSPTTGVFDSDMIRMGSGYKVEKYNLGINDVLFLYTDGIEEATRLMRNPDFTVQFIKTEHEVMDRETHKPKIEVKIEESKEEFGPERVRKVIESVFAKQKFILTKEQNPMRNEILEFDFTKSDSSLHDVVFALASIEKVFRMYKPEELQSGLDYIQIDRKIDEYLSKFFNRYDFYAQNKEDEGKENFINYDLMTEDEQGDDLTLLAVKRL